MRAPCQGAGPELQREGVGRVVLTGLGKVKFGGRTLRPASFTSNLAFTKFTSARLEASFRRPTMTAGLRQFPAFFRDVPGDQKKSP